MTIFICVECKELFEVKDGEVVQAMVYEHLSIIKPSKTPTPPTPPN